MKNFPVLLKFIAGCGLLALAACDDKDPSGGDNPPQTEFTITATAITPRGATVSVSPKNQTGAYYFDVVSDKVLRENYGGDFEACFKSGLQQYIDRYAATLTPEEVLTAISSTGDASYTYQWLGDNTKYYILAAGITTAEPGTTTEVEYSEFETLPLIKNEFTFSDITPTDLSVKATVSSADPELRYVTYLVEKEEFDATGLSPEAYVDKTNQELIAYATGLGVTLEDAIEAMSESGVSEFSQNKLAPAVDFLLIAAGINSEGYVITECASREVRTADPRKSDMTFEFQVSDLSPTGAVIKYIPSVKNDRYFYDIAESKELEGLTDEQIMAKRIELAGSYIGFYTTYDDYENDMRSYLDPDTEYIRIYLLHHDRTIPFGTVQHTRIPVRTGFRRMYIRILRRPVPDGQGQLAPGARRRRQVLYALAQLSRRRRDGRRRRHPGRRIHVLGRRGAGSLLDPARRIERHQQKRPKQQCRKIR